MHCLVQLCNCAIKHVKLVGAFQAERHRGSFEDNFFQMFHALLQLIPLSDSQVEYNTIQCGVLEVCLFTHFGLTLVRSIASGGAGIKSA